MVHNAKVILPRLDAEKSWKQSGSRSVKHCIGGLVEESNTCNNHQLSEYNKVNKQSNFQ